VLDQEDADAVVGSPRGKQHISLVKCRFHHKPSQNDQADAERRAITRRAQDAATSKFSIRGTVIRGRVHAVVKPQL
jgi:hypothetical protein